MITLMDGWDASPAKWGPFMETGVGLWDFPGNKGGKTIWI